MGLRLYTVCNRVQVILEKWISTGSGEEAEGYRAGAYRRPALLSRMRGVDWL
jgi:hypothetical protein